MDKDKITVGLEVILRPSIHGYTSGRWGTVLEILSGNKIRVRWHTDSHGFPMSKVTKVSPTSLVKHPKNG
jgi:hypothetical protein